MQTTQEDCFHLGVKALILTQEKKLLLMERNHPSKGMYWDIPGGRIQKEESQIDALLREVKEETGLEHRSGVRPFMMVLTNIRIITPEADVGLIFSIFVLEVSSTFRPILSSEHIDFEWCTLLESAERLKLQYPIEFLENILYL